MTSTFRDMIRRITPGWLSGAPSGLDTTKLGYVGSRYLYSIGAQFDIMGDAVVEGIRKRFPLGQKVLDASALAATGRDRSISRGPNEPLSSYATRLVGWIDDMKTMGSAVTMLRQIQGYLTPDNTRIRYVNDRGFWITLETDGSVSYVTSPLVASFGNWDWDHLYSPTVFSRFWIIIYCNGGKPFDVGPRWGDPGVVYSNSRTWGTTATPDQVKGIRAIVQDWKAAHSWCQNIIIAFDPASFDPTGPQGAPLPDGTWGNYTKTTAVPAPAARLSTARYWQGT